MLYLANLLESFLPGEHVLHHLDVLDLEVCDAPHFWHTFVLTHAFRPLIAESLFAAVRQLLLPHVLRYPLNFPSQIFSFTWEEHHLHIRICLIPFFITSMN
jgi:hypothetical protein